MVEPERVLHSVMVIAFERKGIIDENLKIINAVQKELSLGNDEKNDALNHIKKFRGVGDWSGKRDAVVSVAIDRIEEAVEIKLINNPSIQNALKKLIDVTLNQQIPRNNPLSAFEDSEDDTNKNNLQLELNDDTEIESDMKENNPQENTIINKNSLSISETDDFEDFDEDIDPFDLIGGRNPINQQNNSSTYRDPLDELMDEVDDEVIEIETIELNSDNDNKLVNNKKNVEPKNERLEMYRMMLDTVWVDDLIDPSEVALLARKRKELDISFETHMKLVREMLEDSD
tara:strand:+ start:3323 stop:4183 length:861 start_codon:yes stop_codon:yes gene_type:complete